MDDSSYAGEIQLFTAGFEPADWAYCDGRLLDIASNGVLFSVLGNRFGGSAASGTFALPRLSDRVPGARYVICVNGIAPITGSS